MIRSRHRVDFQQETGGRTPHCGWIRIVVDRADYSFSIDALTVEIFLRATKLPHVWPCLAICLFDASTLHSSPPELFVIGRRRGVHRSPADHAIAGRLG